MKKNLNILIIETDPLISTGLKEKISRLDFTPCGPVSPDSPIEQLEALSPDMAILGPSLNRESCLMSVHQLKIIDPLMPVLISCDDWHQPEGSAIAPFEGIHYLSPDSELNEFSRVMDTAFEQRDKSALQPDFPVIIGESLEINNIRRKIRDVSDKDITVLITGESGTGKELIARSIHLHSRRNSKALVKINCGALPDDLLESEVFGFKKGAFTGAHKDKPGRFELADGGTLFIDEIGAVPLSIQVKFLQMLEDKGFASLGGTREKFVDVRFVVATNSDLLRMVHEGTFRKDLYYRLNVIHIIAPPLRERKDDIPRLAHYFVNKYGFELKKGILDIPQKISDFFMGYHWPGNVRELENVIRRAIVVRDWNFIFKELRFEDINQAEVYQSFIENETSLPAANDMMIERFIKDEDFSLKKITRSYVSKVERGEILKALRVAQWNRKTAAQLLRISYKTLLNRIREFNLNP